MKIENLTKEQLNKNLTIQLKVLTWMSVHGNLCLALRHPDNNGPSKLFAKIALKVIEQKFELYGYMDQEDLKKIHEDQAEALKRQAQRNIDHSILFNGIHTLN